jgi:hypothetical protein
LENIKKYLKISAEFPLKFGGFSINLHIKMKVGILHIKKIAMTNHKDLNIYNSKQMQVIQR